MSVILVIAVAGVGFYFVKEKLIPYLNPTSNYNSAMTESPDPDENKENADNKKEITENENADNKEEIADNRNVDNEEEEQDGKIDGIRFKQNEIVVDLGQDINLWEFLIADGVEKSHIIWSSDNPYEIMISQDGVAKALSAGAQANITAKNTKDDSELAICKVITNTEGAIENPNDDSTELNSINVYESNYNPAVRNKGYKWDNTLFYTLEEFSLESDSDGQIYYYDLERKQLINEQTQNEMEYEIYRNPDTGIVNKIVSIEYFDGYVEITDYYYTDNGAINFIFVKQSLNYDSTQAIPSNAGQRYYFHRDVMVKWRIVDEDENQKNYILGEAEKARGSNSGTVILYDDLSQQLKKSFDEVEVKMINAAYNTFKKVVSEP